MKRYASVVLGIVCAVGAWTRGLDAGCYPRLAGRARGKVTQAGFPLRTHSFYLLPMKGAQVGPWNAAMGCSFPISAPARSKKLTLGEFRRKYLTQRVILMGHKVFMDSLLGWDRLKRVGDLYERNYGSLRVPSSYKDEVATVVDVWAKGNNVAAATNALGEVVSDDHVDFGMFRLVVQFDDGTLAGKDMSLMDFDAPSQSFPTWDQPLILVSVRDRHKEIVAGLLPLVIGKKLYAVADSDVFRNNITADEIVDNVKRYAKRLHDVPLLTPLLIAAAKYDERYDAVVLKLRLPDGREALTATRYRDVEEDTARSDTSFLGRIAGDLLTSIPKDLTQHEIRAIQAQEVYRGMRKRAVLLSWGQPSKENDWGTGGTQLVYGDTQFVYLDRNNAVVDWQTLGK